MPVRAREGALGRVLSVAKRRGVCNIAEFPPDLLTAFTISVRNLSL